jgi:Rod binding domain-containing protein
VSISVSTDIVLDVMKAAGPAKRAAAVASLGDAQAVANRKFEAVMLRSMTEEMMPKDAGGLYGEGTAGNIWRSLQADLMSQEMAKGGGIGIARMLAKSQDRIGGDGAALNAIEPLNREPQVRNVQGWPYFAIVDFTGKPA